MSRKNLKQALTEQSRRLGFDALGVARAEALSGEADRLLTWLESGRHGSMAWMENHAEKRRDPKELVTGARSVVSVLHNYFKPHEATADPSVGRISRYAWGDDYHDVMRAKMNELLDWLDREAGGVTGRAFVDSAPVMEKAWARRAGLGWIGKHTNLIHPQMGSWFFIGELIIDLELEPDEIVTDHCGTCTRCIDACPTGALDTAYQIDARRCISYLTIESRAEQMPDDLAGRIDNWIFGCDVCQDVCPWNRFRSVSTTPAYDPRPGTLDTPLEAWLDLDEESFQERFRKSPVKRAKWKGFMRNVRAARRNANRRPQD